jgi:Fis family transcriptional regulator
MLKFRPGCRYLVDLYAASVFLITNNKSETSMSTSILEAIAPTYEAPQAQQQAYPLSHQIKDLFNKYIAALDGETPRDLYDLFLGEFEKPFLEAMLTYTRHNQSKAAILLGISRGTLRKKLKTYDLL